MYKDVYSNRKQIAGQKEMAEQAVASVIWNTEQLPNRMLNCHLLATPRVYCAGRNAT